MFFTDSMKKKLFIVAFLSMAFSLNAAERTPEDALRIAGQFASQTNLHRAPAKSSKSNDQYRVVAKGDAYYAITTNDSYVLVSADDRLPEVLGYSDSGSFDTDNLSPAFRFWLACYDEELAAMDQNRSAIQRAPRKIPEVRPLVKSKWNQRAPFDNLVPARNADGDKCATGCVATAMSQIMFFHRYPQQGTGSHSYSWTCKSNSSISATLSADFGATTYGWANMRNDYRSDYTEAQAAAVATLMYHCGVSVDMNYGNTSSAHTEDVPWALKTYFGYDANYQRIRKDMYPGDSINTIIAAELAARRPVLVSGRNSEGGHAFICDGCDEDGLFHINWGWGGSNDGYYRISTLNPNGTQGVGGTTMGYNQKVSFFIGLQPATEGTPIPIPQIATTTISVSSESLSRSSSFSLSITEMHNYGLTDFNGSYGVAIYNEDETQLIAVLKQKSISLNANYYKTSALTLSSLTIPNSVPAGIYHLCAVYKDANYGWMRMMCTEDDYYRTFELTDTQVTFLPNNADPELTITSALSFPEGTNADSIPQSGIPVSFEVKNIGGTFTGQISARIYYGSFLKGTYEIVDSVILRRNQTLSMALQQPFNMDTLSYNTKYKMQLCWRSNPKDDWSHLTPKNSGALQFKLFDPEYHLSLTEAIYYDRNDSVPRSNANLHYSIRNTGAPFDGELQLTFLQDAVVCGRSEIRQVHIATNETLSDSFSGPLDLQPGIYDVVLRYRDSEGDWQEFWDSNNHNLGAVIATVYDDTLITTGLINGQSATTSRQLLMRLGAYDLYLVTTRSGDRVERKKVFLPCNP